jgi:midasin (ATPase involved in ribosome maturation)
LEYRGIGKNKREKYWFLITNFTLTKDNVYQIMREGRARHKIENETFNTLKNQGYYYEHNFGYEQKHLTTVLAYLMMIAFFIDQLQQLYTFYFKILDFFYSILYDNSHEKIHLIK